jgi:hypothetical protein
MHRIELLAIEDCVQIAGHAVFVIPNFSVSAGWKNRTETVAVTKPDGQRYEAKAQFNLTHFNISDPKASIDNCRRIDVCFPETKKEELPAGSRIFVLEEIGSVILPLDRA